MFPLLEKNRSAAHFALLKSSLGFGHLCRNTFSFAPPHPPRLKANDSPLSVSIIWPICSHLSTSGLFAVWRLNCYSWELRSRFHLSTSFLSSTPPPPIFRVNMLEAAYSGASHAHTRRVPSETGCLFSSRVFVCFSRNRQKSFFLITGRFISGRICRRSLRHPSRSRTHPFPPDWEFPPATPVCRWEFHPPHHHHHIISLFSPS